MKNVLFIVYYFPPMGGSGVQRPLKFAKYLREFGWNPIILCPEPGAYHTFDESLNDELESFDIEIHRVSGNTPLHKMGSKRQIKLPSWLDNSLRKISTFFWIPDNKKGWIKPAVEKAKEIISSREINAVFSTANPYSNLIIGKQIKEEHSIPVIMDLRDEWLESHLINYPTRWHYNKMKKIEAETLSSADMITVINDAYKESFGKRFLDQRIEVVNQGFDPEDFIGSTTTINERLTILYSGLFYGKRTPTNFLRAVKNLIHANPEYKDLLLLQFQGGLNSETKKLIEDLGLSNIVEDLGYVPHDEAVLNLQKADVLWLMMGHLSNARYVTIGKLFEYFGSKKPILALVPEGETIELLKKYGSFYSAEPQSVGQIQRSLQKVIVDYQTNSFSKPDEEFVKKFDRKEITGYLAELFNSVTS